MNNNGFPFAEFEFQKSEIINSKINLTCNLNSGPLVKIDSIINPEITKKELQLIYKFTDIRNGDLFELNKIYRISENIKNTGFIQEIRPPAYEFIDNKASIYTYYKPQSKNSINGLVGIQPGENETVQFTGNVALNFQNAFSYGEVLKINWRRMFNSSQNLIAEFGYPFLFNTNFEIQGGLDMIKKDSSFFNFNSKLIINYKSNSIFSNGFLFTNNNSTNLLEDDYSSTSVNSFGFVTNFKKLDNPLNPRRGFKIQGELAYGWKETYAIDTVTNNILKSPNFNGNLSFSSYLSLFKRTTFKIKLSGSTIQNNILYDNELTRIGGYKTIRGFDDESIWVSSFILGNFEFRYLIDEKSNFFLFSDFAWTESKNNNFLKEDYFQSFGFGTNISMQNGLLTLIYGLGRKIDYPFLIRTGKIHLGFTSYF
jgi:hemolysin activation/secretion protein